MIVYATEALAELADIIGWYESKRSGLGTRFLAAIEEHALQIDSVPTHGAFVAHVRGRTIRKVLVRGFPYRIFYTEEGPHIILTVHHQHRLSPDIQGRLDE